MMASLSPEESVTKEGTLCSDSVDMIPEIAALHPFLTCEGMDEWRYLNPTGGSYLVLPDPAISEAWQTLRSRDLITSYSSVPECQALVLPFKRDQS